MILSLSAINFSLVKYFFAMTYEVQLSLSSAFSRLAFMLSLSASNKGFNSVGYISAKFENATAVLYKLPQSVKIIFFKSSDDELYTSLENV